MKGERMNKRARTKIYIFSLIFIMVIISIFIIGIVGSEESPIGNSVTTYTETTETTCSPVEETNEICYTNYCVDYDVNETGDLNCVDLRETYCRTNIIKREECSKTLYSGVMYAQNSSGDWVNPSDVLRITRNEDDLTFHYDGNKGVFDITFETGVFYNGNYKSMAEVKQAIPQIQFDFPTEKYDTYRKYAVNISSIPLVVQPNIDNITLTYKSHNGFTLDQLKSANKRYDIKEIMGLIFNDLLDNGFEVNIDISEKRIYISNITEDKFIDNELWLDPTITLSDNSTELLEDIEIHTKIPVTITTDRKVLFKFNITSIPTGQTIDNSYLGIYVYANSTGWDGDLDIYRIDNQTWTENDTLDSLKNLNKGNLTQMNSGFCELPSIGWCNTTDISDIIKSEYDLSNENVSIWLEDPDHNGSLQNETSDGTNGAFGLGDTGGGNEVIFFYSRDYSLDNSLKPYLNITYHNPGNITISDCSTLNENAGHYYLDSDITDSATSNCMDVSVDNVILDCQGHTIDGNGAADYGLKLDDGIGFSPVNNFTLLDCTFTDWDTTAFNLVDGDNGNYERITIKGISGGSNDLGIEMLGADNNNFTNLSISGHSITDIEFDTGTGNIFYNSLFNSTTNVRFDPIQTYQANEWNITNQSGTPFIGGITLGGNYWSSPDYMGYSDVCVDSNLDGFCDKAYNVSTDSTCIVGIDCGINVDYLPLTTVGNKGSPPQFEPISNFALDEDFSTLTLDLSANVSDIYFGDIDSDLNFTYTNSDPTKITVTSIANGTAILTLDSVANISGASDINITVWDMDGLQNSTNFTLTINPVNDNPWNDGLSNPSAINEDSGVNDNIVTNAQLKTSFRDVEEDNLPTSYQIMAQNGSSIINCELDGSFNIDCTTVANQSGYNTVTVRLSDSLLFSPTGLYTEPEFTITVNAVNDPPWIESTNTTFLNRTDEPSSTNNTNTIYENESIKLEITMQDVEDLSNLFNWVWYLNGVLQNIFTNIFTYHFGMESKGEYNITGVGNDTGGLESAQEFNITVLNLNVLTISEENYSPTTIYNNISSYLNATITDTNNGGIDTIWIEGNWTGNYVNYTNFTDTFTQDGTVFSFYLDYGNLTNQDIINWTYYANDTNGEETKGTTLGFLVENRNATIPSGAVVITPDPAIDTDTLNCSISNYWDYDNDVINFYYEWFNTTGSDVLLTEASLSESNLSSGNFTNTNQIKCRVTPYDPYGNGTFIESQTIEIGSSNVAPTITESNATTGITNVISDSTNPTNNNTYVHFEIAFTDNGDAINDNFLLFICDDTSTANSTGGCSNIEYCSNTTNGTEIQLSCDYNIRDTDTSQSYNWKAFVNDNVLSSAGSSGTFDVNHPPENISVILPINESKETTDGVILTYSGNDIDSDTITYYVYASNTTVPPSSFVIGTGATSYNYTVDELTYYWYVWAKDVHNYYSVENSSMYSFSVDYTSPNDTIINPVGTFSSYTVDIEFNVTDNIGVDSCEWNITKGGLLSDSSGLLTNCIVDTTQLLTDQAEGVTYTFNLQYNDSYNNWNSNSTTFDVDIPSPTTPSSGGVGSATPITKKKVNETCNLDNECESNVCDFNSRTETKNKCVGSVLSLCGNKYCDGEKGETSNSCNSDCSVGAIAVQTYGGFTPFGKGVIWTTVGAVGLLFVSSLGVKVNPKLKKSLKPSTWFRRKKK